MMAAYKFLGSLLSCTIKADTRRPIRLQQHLNKTIAVVLRRGLPLTGQQHVRGLRLRVGMEGAAIADDHEVVRRLEEGLRRRRLRDAALLGHERDVQCHRDLTGVVGPRMKVSVEDVMTAVCASPEWGRAISLVRTRPNMA